MKKFYTAVTVTTVLILAFTGCTAKKIEEPPVKKGIEGQLQLKEVHYLDYRDNKDLYKEGEDSISFIAQDYDETTLSKINHVIADVENRNIMLSLSAENSTNFFSSKYPNNADKIDTVLSQYFDYLSLEAVEAGGSVITGNLDEEGTSFVFTYRLEENFKVKGLKEIVEQKLTNEVPGLATFHAREQPEGTTELVDNSSFTLNLGTADNLVDKETRECIIETGFNWWWNSKNIPGAEISVYVQDSPNVIPGVYGKGIPESEKQILTSTNICGSHSQFL